MVRYSKILTAALLFAVCGTTAQAALFADDEARRGVLDLRARVDEQQRQIQQMASGGALMNIADSIDALRREIAELRGQVEVLHSRIDLLDKRQKDLYVDLDNRLRKFEQGQAEHDKAAQAAAAEQQAYEAGLAHFKANNYGAAIQSLQSFLATYPESTLAPSAQYWIGNAHYALRDYKAAIAAQDKVVKTWPDNAKAPDALLNMASSQAESGDLPGSRKTLQAVVAKYPKSSAAEQAKQRLAKR
ncbi:MAG TPA: tol-pal system protein YbgF [Burkholderiales bacterium]